MSGVDNKFPVLRANKYQHCPRFVRWDLLNPHRALDNHSQTLQRLSERGGLSPLELMANLNDEPFDYRKAELKDAKVKAVARLQKIAWSEDHPTIESLQATIKELEESIRELSKAGAEFKYIDMSAKNEILKSRIKELEEKQRDLVYHLNNKTFGASLDCSPTEAWRLGRSQVIEAVEKFLTQLDE